MLQIASLNSGSNGNCYYVGNNNEAVLIDAGLGCRETERRMKDSGLEMEKVRAIFISHEHADHISGVGGLSKKFSLPVYITDTTLGHCPVPVNLKNRYSFENGKSVSIGGLNILPFTKSHDANDPHSFIVTCDGINVGVMTDMGYACKQALHYFGQCHAVFLESNYCPDMLANGHYPYYLQQRISSDRGHLSNRQALELFQHYRSRYLNLLILSHLSKNNNHPDLVKKIFTPHANDTEVFIASRYEPSPVFAVSGVPQFLSTYSKPSFLKPKPVLDNRQLSLF